MPAHLPAHPPTRLPAVTQRQVSDLRNATRLADLVEALHERIATLPGVARDGRMTGILGITGLVYKSIRGVTRLVGAAWTLCSGPSVC